MTVQPLTSVFPVSVSALTDVGSVRTNNEDNFLSDKDNGLFIVADGMGGHNAGEVASKNACTIIKREILNVLHLRDKYANSGANEDIKALRKSVEEAMNTACKEINYQAKINPEQSGMGTTCTVMFLVGRGKAILGHVGDSRLYVLRKGELHQLSEDHTFVNELVKRGALNPDQAKNHPQSNVLSRAMGAQASVAIDTMIFDIDPGDTYLLCSDGLYNYFDDNSEIIGHLSAPSVEESLNALIKTANNRGGHDNITGIILRFKELATFDEETAAKRRIELLQKIPIFTHLDYNELVRVVGLTSTKNFAKDDILCQEGDDGDEFYVVLSGEVEVIKQDNILTNLKTGSHLGEMSMVDNAPRSATIKATCDLALLVMRREEFFSLIRSEPVIATKLLWSFVQVLSSRLRNTNDALQDSFTTTGDNLPFEITNTNT